MQFMNFLFELSMNSLFLFLSKKINKLSNLTLILVNFDTRKFRYCIESQLKFKVLNGFAWKWNSVDIFSKILLQRIIY